MFIIKYIPIQSNETGTCICDNHVYSLFRASLSQKNPSASFSKLFFSNTEVRNFNKAKLKSQMNEFRFDSSPTHRLASVPMVLQGQFFVWLPTGDVDIKISYLYECFPVQTYFFVKETNTFNFIV